VLATDGFLVGTRRRDGQATPRLAAAEGGDRLPGLCQPLRRPAGDEVLVKTRYTQIWAFQRDGKQLWTVTMREVTRPLTSRCPWT